MPDLPVGADRSLTLVTIASSDSLKPQATVHTRSWEVPPVFAAMLADMLAGMFGPPAEGLCPAGSTVDLAAVEGHLFISGGDDA